MSTRWLLALATAALASCTFTQPPCAAGTASCGCKEGDACDEGLVCGPGARCVAPTLAPVQVSDATARGCELVLEEQPGTTVATVTFKEGVQGRWLRQAPKVSVAFVARADVPLSGLAVLGLVGPSAGITIARMRCVDTKGAVLPGATVSVP